ncbi:MAG: DUF305 domain-containing protein [Actinomycetota bacterium]|nr:DUF305 domain-containing protein [Actinomycetota bacterium]
MSGVSRGLQIGALVLASLLALLIAGIVGRTTAGPSSPGDSSAAAGFARDMTDHHAQAVDMATIIGGRTKSEDVRTLATDVALTQTNQMGQMQGWLRLWNLPLGRVGPPMTWMSASGGMDMSHVTGATTATMDPALMRPLPDGRMPGLATNAQINQLRTLPVGQADVLFLQLLIAHHKAGVVMAQMAEALTRDPVVDRLAGNMVTGQQNEITQMTQMLKLRGAQP